MTLVLANALLVDPETDSTTPGSLVIREGRIAGRHSGSEHPSDSEVIDCEGACLAPGIVDIGVKIGEPGERHKESFRTAGLAAAAGGVTTVITRPDTVPPIDNPETLEFFVRRARAATSVQIRPMATLTKGRAGKEISEIGLLSNAGAVAFSDARILAFPVRSLSGVFAWVTCPAVLDRLSRDFGLVDGKVEKGPVEPLQGLSHQRGLPRLARPRDEDQALGSLVQPAEERRDLGTHIGHDSDNLRN